MSWRMHIAIVDCVTTHPTRYLPPSFYTSPLQKKKKAHLFEGELYYEEEDCDEDRTSFYKFVDNDFGLKEDKCIGRFDIPADIGQPFYVNEETQKLFEYYNPRIISKTDFEWIIEMYRKLVVEQYKEILSDRNKESRWRCHIEAKLDLWESPYIEPYNMDKNQSSIVRAYNLEYQIFDLVRMYKSIDWIKDTVIFFGWQN